MLAFVAAYAYWYPGHWLFFPLLLFPNIALFAYLGGNRNLAVIAHNVLHTYALVALLGLFAVKITHIQRATRLT